MNSSEHTETDVYGRIQQSGIQFNPEQKPGGIYEPVTVFGDSLCYVSGHNCKVNGVLPHKGRLGQEVTIEQGCEDARQCVVNILTSLHNTIGDLNQIKRIVKVLAFVASSDTFYQQPKVVDAASQLLIDIFGEKAGKAARSAVGVNVLPNNQPVEIEMLIELYTGGKEI